MDAAALLRRAAGRVRADTEPEAGSDAGNTRTRAGSTARSGSSTGRSSSSRTAAPTSRASSRSLARTGEGEISNLLVPNGARLRGRRAVPQDGLERLGHAAAQLRGLPRAEDNLVGPRGQGFKQFLQTLDGGRIGVSAMGVGLAQGALDEALAYAKERIAFGQPISKYQAIQAKLADLSTEIEAARLLTYKAAIEKDLAAASPHRRAGQAEDGPARGARHRGGRADPRRLRLHRGVSVCRFYRDAKILTIGEGTDEVQQMVIARALGC